MKRPDLSRSSARGFTMAEILIVLVVLAVVLTLAAPSLTGMLSVNQTEGLTSRIASDLATARMEAVRAGRRVDFTIYSGGTRYAVVRQGAGSEPADTLRKVDVATEFPGVMLEPGTLTLIFDSRGLVRSSAADARIAATRGGVKSRLTVTTVGNVYRDQ